jgi:hypothetical protein
MKLGFCTTIFNRNTHLKFRSRTRPLTLLCHSRFKASIIHAQTTLTRNICSQIYRKTIGVIELEGDVAGEGLAFAETAGFVSEQAEAAID